MSTEFVIIKDNELTSTIDQAEFTRFMLDKLDLKLSKILQDKHFYKSKKFTKEDILDITEEVLVDGFIRIERILKVRRTP